MSVKFKRTARVVKNIFFPPRCVSCREIIDPLESDTERLVFCPSCLEKFKRETAEFCPKCSRPALCCRCAPKKLLDAGAGELIKLSFYRVGQPDLPSSRLIYNIKHNKNSYSFAFVADMLARELCDELDREKIEYKDLIFTYAPRRYAARAEYGLDQAKALAGSLCRALGLSRSEHLFSLISRRGGLEQKTLSAAERAENIESAYSLSGKLSLSGRTLILVDDVVTSGASMAGCVSLLLSAGAERVICVSVAKSAKKFE